MSTARNIHDGWEYTQVGGGQGTSEGEWLKTNSFPTTVHVELLQAKKIPDPFLGLNEYDVQWIGESTWAFRTTFEASEAEMAADNIDLVFDSVDTFASITLNGHKILQTESQFISYTASVKDHTKAGSNELVLTFESAFFKGRKLEKEHGKLNLWNGDSSRLHVRKAQYNYGWDWGPVLMTIGPWRPISLHTYSTRITDLDIRSEVSAKLDIKMTVDVTLSAAMGKASFVLTKADGTQAVPERTLTTSDGHAKASFEFNAGELDLWYPVNYGAQPLYAAEVQVYDPEGKLLDSKTQTISFRRALVVQEPLLEEPGKTFLFEVNGIRIFCGGSNWIPLDSFLTTVTPARYRAWLELTVEGNQNMVRVWGGGIYEPDVFYDICDELGILVWQDFMFGCGQYPAYDSLLALVEVEAEQTVKRLRHHPSLVIFAGNNEDYQVAESLNLELDYSDETSDFRKTNFPARYIYERTLPAAVKKFSSGIFYHRGSPYSGEGQKTTDKTLGDLHQWNVWHGQQRPWHEWDQLAGRFVSEFGMQGFPDIRTADYWLGGDKSQRHPQSRVMNSHNKADGFERRLELYLVENFKHSFEMESYVYYTQVMQAETLASAYRLWRRNWGGRGREKTAGALVWQINDCWPTTSWAIVDYFMRPKPAFFAIARELRPFTVGMTRKETKAYENDLTAAAFTITTVLEIWGTNSTLKPKEATLEVKFFDLHSDWTGSWSKEVVLAENASTELYKGDFAGLPPRTKASEVPKVIVVSARLIVNGEVLGRYLNWPEPFKFINFPSIEEAGLKAEIGQDGETVTLTALKPIKGVVLDAEGEHVKWSDQALDIAPGDTQIVEGVGLKGRKVLLRYLGDGTA